MHQLSHPYMTTGKTRALTVQIFVGKVMSLLFNTLPRLVLPGGLDGKESARNVRDSGSIPGSGRSSGEGHGSPMPVFLPGEFCGQKNLVNYSLWGHKESNTAEPLTLLLIFILFT